MIKNIALFIASFFALSQLTHGSAGKLATEKMTLDAKKILEAQASSKEDLDMPQLDAQKRKQ